LVGTFKHSSFLTDQLNKAMQQRRSAAERLENNNKELPRVTTLKQDVTTLKKVEFNLYQVRVDFEFDGLH
jgi:uncharacterized membrane-anchored protein